MDCCWREFSSSLGEASSPSSNYNWQRSSIRPSLTLVSTAEEGNACRFARDSKKLRLSLRVLCGRYYCRCPVLARRYWKRNDINFSITFRDCNDDCLVTIPFNGNITIYNDNSSDVSNHKRVVFSPPPSFRSP